MSVIETFNSAVSNAVNKGNADYTAILGDENFTPEVTISSSEDFNCGALCNEIEFLRTVSNYYVRAFDIDNAEGDELDALVNAFIDLPRRNRGEPDATFRNRFRSLVVEQLNRRRTTKWAIMDALRYFISNVSEAVQVIEIFEIATNYFELRIEGTVSFDEAIFLNNTEQGFLNQNFVGGEGVGEVISYIGEIIDRIKAAGIDYDIIFIKQNRFTQTVDAFIGTIQRYKSVDAVIKATKQSTKSIDAQIV